MFGAGFPSCCVFNGFERICFAKPFAPAFVPFVSSGFSFVPLISGYERSEAEVEPTESTLAEEPRDVPAAEAKQPLAILVLRDGTVFVVSDYWIEGGWLHCITAAGAKEILALEDLDLARTVEQNSARGVEFLLRVRPASP